MQRFSRSVYPSVMALSLVGALACGDSSGTNPTDTSDSNLTTETNDPGSGSGTDDDDDDSTGETDTTGSETNSGTSSDTDCDKLDFVAPVVPPNVILSLDKSGSMTKEWLDGDKKVTRWRSLYQTVSMILESHGASTNFGLKLFPSTSATAQSPNDCAMDPGVEVPVAPNNGAAILAALPGPDADVQGATPSMSGLVQAYEALLPFTSIGDQADVNREAVILITDGRVNCGQTDAEMRSKAAAMVADTDVKVYVIGVDIVPNPLDPDDADDPTLAADLDALAAAGGTSQAIKSDDADGLREALSQIIGEIVSCELDLGDKRPGRWDFVHVDVENVDHIAFSATAMTCDQAAALNAMSSDPKEHYFVYSNAEQSKITICGDGCTRYKQIGTAQVRFECVPPE
jgi:hypothetical protein